MTATETRATAAKQPKQVRRWHIYHDPRDLLRYAQRAVLGAAAEALSRHGRFDLAISGGTLLRRLWRQFSDRQAGDGRWHIWFADEYCLPEGHPGRNDTVVRDLWLGDSRVPEGNIHRIPYAAAPEDTAGRYMDRLADLGPFDLVLLSMGADGHAAGLFPGHGLAEFQDAPDVLAVHAPDPPHGRITLSARRLSETRQLVLLVSGEDHRQAVGQWRSGRAELPVSRLVPRRGIDVFADEGAIPGF